jgi:uncharacterized protein YggE
MRFWLTVGLAVTAVAGAQAPADRRLLPPNIRTTGEASVSAKPDRAILDIGVVTQAATAQAAGSENASQTSAVLSRLRSLGTAAEIKTVSYSLAPNYRYPPGGGQPLLTGYTAHNTLELTTGDLDLVAKAIDLATQSGANNIQRLQFTLKDEGPARAQALRQAAAQARANAEAVASALGLKIVRVLSVDQVVQTPIRPMPARAMAAAATAPPTPVEPGVIEIPATVTLTVQVE